MKRTAAILITALAVLFTGGPAHANPGAIANGMGWLESNQHPSGGFIR